MRKRLTGSFAVSLWAVTAFASELVNDICDVGRDGGAA